ncbi:MAG: hypothetical protein ACE364_00695 [Chlorobiota bacterium]
MKKITQVILLLVFLPLALTSEPIFIGSVQQGAAADSISPKRIYSALKFALDMTAEHHTTPDSIRTKTIAEADSSNTYDDLAKKVGAKFTCYASVDVLHNMLRANITLTDRDGSDKTGFGYAAIHHIKDGKQVYDIALVKAFQRAAMNVIADTTIYDHQPKEFQVKPAGSLVVGGFIMNDNDIPFNWELFANESVTSYYASESIYEAAIDADNYAVYDIATRDSMYAMFNIYMVENSSPASASELKMLSQFDVQYYLYGQLDRDLNSADMKIILAELNNGKIRILNVAEGILNSDNKEKMKALIQKLTKQALSISNNKGNTD